jgi:hypothetical protein
MLKRLTIALTIALLTSVAAQAGNSPQKKSQKESSFDRYEEEDCQQMQRYSMTDLPARLVAQEEKRIARASVQALDVEGSRNGGVSIKGWDQPDILVRACKLAAAETKEQAQALLDQLIISTDNGKVRSAIPSKELAGGRQSWVVQFRIYVPRDLAVEASAHNGGLSFANLTGKITGRSQNGGISLVKSGSAGEVAELYAVNGGISLDDVEGNAHVQTDNGGISLSGGKGAIKLQSKNGGITIRLTEGQWSGETLEAHSDNGGLTLEAPPGFSSGIEAETSKHTRLDCLLPECNQSHRDLDDSRNRVQIGGQPVVHVSTRNGSLRIVQSK